MPPARHDDEDDVKTKIEKTQKKKSKCRLSGDRDETIDHINECSKLAQKEYKTRPDRVGKVIYWELRKKLKFDHANKYNMHNSEFALENLIQKILWDFEIQANHLMSARQPDL